MPRGQVEAGALGERAGGAVEREGDDARGLALDACVDEVALRVDDERRASGEALGDCESLEPVAFAAARAAARAVRHEAEGRDRAISGVGHENEGIGAGHASSVGAERVRRHRGGDPLLR